MAELETTEPIEVWLTEKNLEVTCMVVMKDESTRALDVESLSMRGAQREVTGWLISKGYHPAGRWMQENAFGKGVETSRRFRPGEPKPKRHELTSVY